MAAYESNEEKAAEILSRAVQHSQIANAIQTVDKAILAVAWGALFFGCVVIALAVLTDG